MAAETEVALAKGFTPRKQRLVAKAVEKKDEILALHNAGKSAATIEDLLGLSLYGVRSVIQSAGLKPRAFDLLGTPRGSGGPESFPEARALDQEYRKLYESGMTLRAIGDHFGVSYQRVKQRLDRSGCVMRPSTKDVQLVTRECTHCRQPFAARPKLLRKYCSSKCHREAASLSPKVRGSQVGSAKLTEEQVLEMRRLRAAGASVADCAKQFGVTVGAVSHICQRRSWKHI